METHYHKGSSWRPIREGGRSHGAGPSRAGDRWKRRREEVHQKMGQAHRWGKAIRQKGQESLQRVEEANRKVQEALKKPKCRDPRESERDGPGQGRAAQGRHEARQGRDGEYSQDVKTCQDREEFQGEETPQEGQQGPRGESQTHQESEEISQNREDDQGKDTDLEETEKVHHLKVDSFKAKEPQESKTDHREERGSPDTKGPRDNMSI